MQKEFWFRILLISSKTKNREKYIDCYGGFEYFYEQFKYFLPTVFNHYTQRCYRKWKNGDALWWKNTTKALFEVKLHF